MSVISEKALLDVSSLLIMFLLSEIVYVNSTKVLTVALYKVLHDGALIDWHLLPENKQNDIDYCEYVYSALNDKEHQQISSDVSPGRTVDVVQLTFNTTYYFHMVCYDKENNSFVSNTINFTTGYENDESVNYLMSMSQKIPSSNGDNPFQVALDLDRTNSSNVILGALCGIVGFLIINATIVLAMRKYSHWQIRRRRIIELEDRDYNGFEYLHNMD